MTHDSSALQTPDQYMSWPLMEWFGGESVVLFGDYVLLEQFPPDIALEKFQPEDQQELDALAADFDSVIGRSDRPDHRDAVTGREPRKDHLDHRYTS